jgi:hypothetical protein
MNARSGEVPAGHFVEVDAVAALVVDRSSVFEQRWGSGLRCWWGKYLAPTTDRVLEKDFANVSLTYLSFLVRVATYLNASGVN